MATAGTTPSNTPSNPYGYEGNAGWEQLLGAQAYADILKTAPRYQYSSGPGAADYAIDPFGQKWEGDINLFAKPTMSQFSPEIQEKYKGWTPFYTSNLGPDIAENVNYDLFQRSQKDSNVGSGTRRYDEGTFLLNPNAEDAFAPGNIVKIGENPYEFIPTDPTTGKAVENPYRLALREGYGSENVNPVGYQLDYNPGGESLSQKPGINTLTGEPYTRQEQQILNQQANYQYPGPSDINRWSQNWMPPLTAAAMAYAGGTALGLWGAGGAGAGAGAGGLELGGAALVPEEFFAGGVTGGGLGTAAPAAGGGALAYGSPEYLAAMGELGLTEAEVAAMSGTEAFGTETLANALPSAQSTGGGGMEAETLWGSDFGAGNAYTGLSPTSPIPGGGGGYFSGAMDLMGKNPMMTASLLSTLLGTATGYGKNKDEEKRQKEYLDALKARLATTQDYGSMREALKAASANDLSALYGRIGESTADRGTGGGAAGRGFTKARRDSSNAINRTMAMIQANANLSPALLEAYARAGTSPESAGSATLGGLAGSLGQIAPYLAAYGLMKG
jgi:hypothetical protein